MSAHFTEKPNFYWFPNLTDNNFVGFFLHCLLNWVEPVKITSVLEGNQHKFGFILHKDCVNWILKTLAHSNTAAANIFTHNIEWTKVYISAVGIFIMTSARMFVVTGRLWWSKKYYFTVRKKEPHYAWHTWKNPWHPHWSRVSQFLCDFR